MRLLLSPGWLKVFGVSIILGGLFLWGTILLAPVGLLLVLAGKIWPPEFDTENEYEKPLTKQVFLPVGSGSIECPICHHPLPDATANVLG